MTRNKRINILRYEKQLRRINKPSEESHTGRKIILFLLVFTGIYIYFAKPYKAVLRAYRPLPYVFEGLFHRSIQKYADEEEHGKIIVVHGQKGIGKTVGLKTFQQELLDSGRLAIDFDLLMMSESDTELSYVSFMSKAIVDAVNRINVSNVKKSLIKNALIHEKPASFIVKDKAGSRHFVTTKDPIMKKVLMRLLKTLAPGSRGQTLFEALDALHEGLRPVIIIHEPQKWMKERGCQNFCRENNKLLNQLLHGINADNKHGTGVIVEISDQSLIPEFKKYNNVRFVRPFEFDPDIAMEEFVSKSNIFNVVQFKVMYNIFGGIGEYFNEVKKLMENGYLYSEALRLVITSLKINLVQEVNAYEDKEDAKDILLGIVGKHPVMPNVTHPFTQQLLRNRIFIYASEEMDRVEPTTPGIEDALLELKKCSFKLPSTDLLLGASK